MTTTLVQAGLLVPVVPSAVTYQGGAFTFDGDGRILAIGAAEELAGQEHDRIIDATDKIVMPGMVNAHSHSVSNAHKGQFEKLPLEVWRQYIIAREQAMDEEDVYLFMLTGAIEMLKTGTTSVLDHFYSGARAPHMAAAHALQAWSDIGIRGVLAPMIIDQSYEDTVPLGEHRSPETDRAVERISAYETGEGVQDFQALVEEYRDVSSRITFAVGPGAPQRCSDAFWTSSLELAEEYDLAIHTHVAETRTQVGFMVGKLGRTPVQHLSDLGLLCDRLAMAHCVWVSDSDIKLISQSGASVVHNPASNLKLGSGIAPVIDMLAQGANVSVGSDGPGSNDGQSMFEAAKLAVLLQCTSTDDFERWPSAADGLEMATLNGARACGLQETCGSLEVGKQADFVTLARSHYAFTPMNDVINQLVYCENGAGVVSAYVDGSAVLEDGRCVGVDEEAIYGRVHERMRELGPRMAAEMDLVKSLEPTLRDVYSSGLAAYRHATGLSDQGGSR